MPQPFLLKLLTEHQQGAAACTGVVLFVGGALLALRPPRPGAEAVERARRNRLSRVGRLTDGTLVDTTTIDGSFVGDEERGVVGAPHRLIFRYRIAGVGYEAVQDVSALAEQVRDLRVDLPVQVRYDHHNPADSIVVAEAWTGLRFQREVGTQERA